GQRISVAISPDGTRIVFPVRNASGVGQLATRLLDQPAASVLSGTEGASDPFFSPDGNSIGFFTTQAMKKISLQGGAAATVVNSAIPPRGAWWAETGSIFVAGPASLSRVSAAGGYPESLPNPADQGYCSYRSPQT